MRCDASLMTLGTVLYYASQRRRHSAALKYEESQGQPALPVDLRTGQRLCQPSWTRPTDWRRHRAAL